jgi:hypothetical protein
MGKMATWKWRPKIWRLFAKRILAIFDLFQIQSNIEDAPKLEAASPTVPYIHANGNHHSPVSNHQNEAISRLAASILNVHQQQNAINGFLSGTEQQFPCLLCSQKFNNQVRGNFWIILIKYNFKTAYLLHWSNVHMLKREGMGGMKEVG